MYPEISRKFLEIFIYLNLQPYVHMPIRAEIPRDKWKSRISIPDGDL